jgi:mono/diheme cytochrome c family protein
VTLQASRARNQSPSGSLAEGIVTGHPAMPEFRLEPDQIGDIIAYLKSLERQ